MTYAHYKFSMLYFGKHYKCTVRTTTLLDSCTKITINKIYDLMKKKEKEKAIARTLPHPMNLKVL